MSPRSIRRASNTSCSAVSSDTRPIERRYSRSESSDGSTVRSISTFLRCSGRRLRGRRRARLDAAALGLRGTAVGADDVDPLLVQVRVQLLHLLLGDLDLFEACLDLLERQVSALLTFGDQRTQLLELHDRSLVTQQHHSLIAHGP